MQFFLKIRKWTALFGAVTLLLLEACAAPTLKYSNAAKYRNAAERYRQRGPSHYQGLKDVLFTIPSIPIKKIDPKYHRQIVSYNGNRPPGTIIVIPRERFLYLIQSDRKAIRYGIGVGKQGFSWSGRAIIGWKKKWPIWTPPESMIRRKPNLRKYANGMAASLKNPLGARALYLMQNGRDTLFRIHGTPNWNSIGKAVSSGCIRLLNQDIIDLYERVQSGSTVLVR